MRLYRSIFAVPFIIHSSLFKVTHRQLLIHLFCPPAAAERPEVCDRRVGGHRVRVVAGARPLGPAHRLPPGQVHAGDDGGAVQDEEEDGSQ